MLQIRPFSSIDSIVAITFLLHRADPRLGDMGLNYTAVNQSTDVTAKRMSGGQCLIAEWSGALAGTIVAQPTYKTNECEYFTRPGVAAAHQFAVEPSLQGHGIGRALLTAAETWALEGGFHEIAMDTAEQATHLIELYEGLGYRRVSWVQWSGKVYQSVLLSKRLM